MAKEARPKAKAIMEAKECNAGIVMSTGIERQVAGSLKSKEELKEKEKAKDYQVRYRKLFAISVEAEDTRRSIALAPGKLKEKEKDLME